MAKTRTLAEIYEAGIADRENYLAIARECAALTIPSTLPREGQSPAQRLQPNFQSLGANGVINLEGRMLSALFPAATPWFNTLPAPDILYDPNIPVELKQELLEALFLQDLLVQAVIESSDYHNKRGSPAGFRTVMRQAIRQVIVTGDTLIRFDDDYRLTVFRRTNYITKRSDDGDVVYHIAKERVDPLSLDESQRSKYGKSDAELSDQEPEDRVRDLYTRIQWNPLTKMWVTTQAIEDQVIDESEDPCSSFFAVPFDLIPGENYGRGFIEQRCHGDLSSYETLSRDALDYAGIASKVTPVIDDVSDVKEEDLAKPSGEAIRCRVVDGKAQDIGFLRTDKGADFAAVHAIRAEYREDLGRTMLIQSAAVRDSERTTAFEIGEVTIRELEGALGGFYAPVADKLQIPLVQAAIYKLKRDRKIKPLPEGTYEVNILTGIAALAYQAKSAALLQFAQVAQALSSLDPNGDIRPGVLLRAYARYNRIDEPGAIKTPEEKAAEQQARFMQAAAASAAGKAIDVVGNVVESQATAGA